MAYLYFLIFLVKGFIDFYIANNILASFSCFGLNTTELDYFPAINDSFCTKTLANQTNIRIN